MLFAVPLERLFSGGDLAYYCSTNIALLTHRLIASFSISSNKSTNRKSFWTFTFLARTVRFSAAYPTPLLLQDVMSSGNPAPFLCAGHGESMFLFY